MRILGHLLRAILLGALLHSAFAAAQETKKLYDVPAGDAAAALKQFSAISGRETLFAAEAIRGVKTPAVRGELTAQEAIDALLVDTGLVATVDQKSGAFAVRRETAAEAKNAPSRLAKAQTAPVKRARNAPMAVDGAIELEAFEVTGSRIRSVLGEQGVNPVLSFTRDEIEQSGVTNLHDLRTLIPQLSVGNTESFTGNSAGNTAETRLNFNLRGITGANTLILIDGRRVPRTAQRNAAAENYELTGIPLSAIERVEVLLDGGGAVYGADAVAGVINIITRKNYSGSQIEFTYENTFDKDAAKRNVAFSTSYRKGPFSFRFSAFHENQNALARRDRWWLASDDRRPLGGTDSRPANFAVGVVRAITGTLPGTGGATVLRIPTGSSGRNLTVADFVAAGAPTDADRYDAGLTQNAINENFRWGTNGAMDYRFRSWLTAFADFNFNRFRNAANSGPVFLGTLSSTNPLVNSRLEANYPGNPFGVPINVQKYVWELGPRFRRYQFDTRSVTAGLRGDLRNEWRYQGAVRWVKSESKTLEPSIQFSSVLLAAAMQSATPPVLLHDSIGFGAANPDGTLEALILQGRDRESNQTWSYDLSFDGPVLEWWAGKIRTAFGTEVREEYVDFHRAGATPSTESAEPSEPRMVTSGFAELSIPLIGEGNRLRFLHEATVSLAARSDRYSDFGSALKPRYGLSVRPFSWLLLRGTRGETYRVPNLGDLNRPTNLTTANFTTTGTFVLFDTERNEQLLGQVSHLTGGNPNLRPEEAVTQNYGIVIEPPGRWLRGLSFSIDQWDIEMTNRVSSITVQDRFTFRPDLFTRAAPTPADVAAGIPGRIAAMDSRSINIGLFRTAGRDYSLRYNYTHSSLGAFTLRANATQTTRYESYTRPGIAATASQSPLTRPLRSTAMLDWKRGALGLGVTATFQEGFRSSANSANTQTPAVTLWDFRAMYDFDRSNWRPSNRWVAAVLKGTRVNVALLNALDLEPPLTITGSTTGAVNPLLRRYTITLRKSF